jgi:hypothetical protein
MILALLAQTRTPRFVKRWHCACTNHRFNVVRQLSPDSQKLECLRCGSMFAINHYCRVILPWDDEIEKLYKDLNDRTRR